MEKRLFGRHNFTPAPKPRRHLAEIPRNIVTSPARRPSRNKLRIIGGKWRGRKLDFPPVEGLRPSGDRIRETLFNWLMPALPGARCLDLFAGSGALGFEALSRGAASLVMLDTDARVVSCLRRHCETLNAEHVAIHQSDAISWLDREQPEQAFDIVFVDPPFQSALLEAALTHLSEKPFLNKDALIYIEVDQRERFAPPSDWQLLKQKSAGQVVFSLYGHKG